MSRGALGGADYRQTITLAIQEQGADALTIVRDAIRQVENEIGVLNDQFDGTRPREYINALNALGAQLNKLQQQELGIIQTFEEGTRARIDAIARQERAVIDAAERERQVAGEAMRARIDAYARAERAAEQLAAAERQLSGAEQRARIDNLVRQEQALETLNAQLAKNAEALRQEGVAEQWLDGITVRFATTLKQLAEEEQLCTTATTHQTQAMREAAAHAAGFASVADQNMRAQQRMGYAMINVSYAVQDLQYGFGAVVNNVALVTQSIGQAIPSFAAMTASIGGPAGFGAIVMGAGVAVQVLTDNWGKFTDFFLGAVPKMVGETKGLEEELKKLEDKRLKTSVDYQDIKNAREELARLTAEEAAYQRLKTGKTEEQQKRAEVVSAAITEGGGTGDFASGVDNVIRGMVAATGVTDSARTARLKKSYNELIAMGQEFAAKEMITEHPIFGPGRLMASMAADKENAERAAKQIVTRAAEGNEQARAALAQAFQAAPGKFTALGIDPLRLGAGLEMAAPGSLFEKERRKLAAERAKKEADALKEANRLEQEATDNAARAKKRMADEVYGYAEAQFGIEYHGEAREKREADKVAREKAAAEREKAAAERKAEAEDVRGARERPARERRQAIASYGQEFQARARDIGVPVTGAEAQTAGRAIERLVSGGTDVDTAMQQTFNQMTEHARAGIRAMIKMQATQEAMMNFFGPATEQLQMIEARDAQIRAQLRGMVGRQGRQAQNTPVNAIHNQGF